MVTHHFLSFTTEAYILLMPLNNVRIIHKYNVLANVEGMPPSGLWGASKDIPAEAGVPLGIYCFSMERVQESSRLTKHVVSTLS